MNRRDLIILAVVLGLLTALLAAGGPGYDIGRAVGHLLGGSLVWLSLFAVAFWIKNRIWPPVEEGGAG